MIPNGCSMSSETASGRARTWSAERPSLVDSASPTRVRAPARRRGRGTGMARRGSSGTRAGRGRAGFGRALSMMAFLPLASRFPMYAKLVTALVLDERMPNTRKALLAGAAGYLLLGRDLIPDDVPVIGGLDDVV